MAYKFVMAVAVLGVVLSHSAHAYRAGSASHAMGYSSGGARSTLGYQTGGIRSASFFKSSKHVSSFGKGGKVRHCINCKGAAGIKYKIVYKNLNPKPPTGNWMHGHNPNYRTSRR